MSDRSLKIPLNYQDVAGIVTCGSAQRWANIFRTWSTDPDVLGFYHLTSAQAVAAAGYWQSIADTLSRSGSVDR